MFKRTEEVGYITLFRDTLNEEDLYATNASAAPLIPAIGTKMALEKGDAWYLVQEVEIGLSITDMPHLIRVWVEKLK